MIHKDPNNPTSSEVLEYTEENGQYLVTFGIIAQKKGVYVLGVSGLPQIQKKCKRASVSVKITNSGVHAYFLNQIFYPGSPFNDSVAESTKADNYSFKVY